MEVIIRVRMVKSLGCSGLSKEQRGKSRQRPGSMVQVSAWQTIFYLLPRGWVGTGPAVTAGGLLLSVTRTGKTCLLQIWQSTHIDLIHICLSDSFHLPFLNTDFFSSAHPPIFPFLTFSACLEVPRFYFRFPYISDINLISIYMLLSTLQPPPLPFLDNFFLPPILWLVLIISGNDVCYDTLCAINIYLILPA